MSRKPPNKSGPSSGKNPPNRAKKTVSNYATMRHFVADPEAEYKAADNAVKQRFYLAYEQTFGNVSASCLFAKIHRATYYRWMASSLPKNIEFQRRLREIKPVEMMLDIAEAVVMERVTRGDLQAAMYVLDRKGKGRGYADRSNLTEHQLTVRAVEKILHAIEYGKTKNPDFVPNIPRYIELASKDFGINQDAIEQELNRRMLEDQK